MMLMGPLSLSLLCLAIGVWTAPITFFPSIQTGSHTVDTTPYRAIVSNSIDARFDITLSSAMNITTYKAGLCFDAFQLKIPWNMMSVSVGIYDRTAAILVMNVSSSRGNNINVLKVRYLVVHSNHYFINIHQLVNRTSLQFQFHRRRQFYFSSSLTVPLYTAANCQVFIFLTGFNFTAYSSTNNFDILIKQTGRTNTSITFTFTSLFHMLVNYLSYTIVVIDTKSMVTSLGGSFDMGISQKWDRSSLNRNNANTIIDDNNTFFGICNFHTEQDDTLSLWSTIAPTIISITSSRQLQYMSMSYIIFAVEPCPPPKFVFTANGSCLVSCPIGYLENNSTNQCDACSNSCLSCSNVTTNCTSCPNSTTFLQSGTCQLCNTSLFNCQQCSSSTVCVVCDSLTILNATTSKCDANCTSISFCSTCALTPSLNCSSCSAGYRSLGSSCFEICGDGMIVGLQECDDGNTTNGDGCSQLCRSEPYFLCNGTPSVCRLSSITLTPLLLLKDPNGNVFTLTFLLSPASLPAYNSVNWKLAFLAGSLPVNLEEASYDSASNTLTVRSSYSANLQGQSMAFQFDASHTGASALAAITARQIDLPTESSNNLSLQYFSQQVYNLKKAMQYLALVEGVMAVLLFLAGYFGAKLIALESAAVVQLSYIGLVSLRNISPSFHGLTNLSYSLGYAYPSSGEYNYGNGLRQQFRGMGLSGDFLANYNIVLIFVFAPLALAAGSKLLSVTLMKENPLMKAIWGRFLGEFLLYGLLFSSYTIFLSMGVSIGSWTGNVGNLILGLFFLVLLVVLTVASNYFPKNFGEFKRRFEVMNVCRFTYNFEAAQRFVTPMLLATLTMLNFQMAFIILIFVAKLTFVGIRKPYVPDSWRRPTANLSIATAILSIYLICKMVDETSTLNVIAPAIILLLLSVLLGYNSVLTYRQVRENWKSIVEQKLDSHEVMTVLECERFKFQLFEKQMMPTKNEEFISVINQSYEKISTNEINREWERYADLSHGKIYEEMRERIIRKKREKLKSSRLPPTNEESL